MIPSLVHVITDRSVLYSSEFNVNITEVLDSRISILHVCGELSDQGRAHCDICISFFIYIRALFALLLRYTKIHICFAFLLNNASLTYFTHSLTHSLTDSLPLLELLELLLLFVRCLSSFVCRRLSSFVVCWLFAVLLLQYVLRD